MENLREMFTAFVEPEYVDMLDEEGLALADRYSKTGGTPRTCIGLGLYESANELTLEEIAGELGVTRRAIYNARKEVGAPIRQRRR